VTRAPTYASDGFPGIGEYAFLSDCHTGALVAPDGGIEWLCLPRFDSPSVFGALLDRDAGRFRIGPEYRVPLSRRYLPGTNVLETNWATDAGWLVVRDALAIGPWREDRIDPHARTPTDMDARHMLVRHVECIGGEIEVTMLCNLMDDYGRGRAGWELVGDRHNADTELAGGLKLRIMSDMHLGVDQGVVMGRHWLKEGESCFVALSWDEPLEDPETADQALEELRRSERFWRRWLSRGRFPDHPWRVHLQRSALVLKGLTYLPSGATVAALTTSLPETPGGERNWDYRYTWIRDATFTLWSLHILGFDAEARDFILFIADLCRAEGPELQIMYGIDGRKDLTESTLDHLDGYLDSRPVRIGNGAFDQRQNDVFGALLDSVYIHTKAREHVPGELWEIVADQVEGAISVWQTPDQGIWEARGEPKHYVSSKLMCWVALDRGARLASGRGERELVERWGGIAAEIREDILARGVSDAGVFRQHYETDALDASTLLIPLVRFLPPDDERLRATVLAIARDVSQGGLTRNRLVLRYIVEETDDGLHGEEGSFSICSFWLASALSEIGEPERARELTELLLSMSGDLDLFGEEIESRSGRQLGNFPQAFTHLALINAVNHVIADELLADSRDGPTAVFTEMRGRRS
jgi:GH15 family glucan-1,4-alpha-glucosidase